MKDTLVLDFSLQPGDTLWNILGGSNPSAGFYVWVDAVDSVLVGDDYHRRLHIVTNYPINFRPDTYWIEGVGDVGGFWTWFQYGPGYIKTQLTCFYEDDTLSWTQPSPSGLWDCDVYVGIENTALQQSQISIYPSLLGSNQELQIQNKSLSSGTVQIYNSIGESVIISFELQSNSSTSISVKLPPGIYLLKWSGRNGESVLKELVVTGD